MKFSEYKKQARITRSDGTLESMTWQASTGMYGEILEWYTGDDISNDHLEDALLEAGDVIFYVVWLADLWDIDLKLPNVLKGFSYNEINLFNSAVHVGETFKKILTRDDYLWDKKDMKNAMLSILLNILTYHATFDGIEASEILRMNIVKVHTRYDVDSKWRNIGE